MKSVAFDDISGTDWDALCDASDDAWLFHRSFWVRFETAHSGVENNSFGIRNKNRLVAIAPLYKSQLGLGAFVETLIHDGYNRHTGLAMLPDLDNSEAKAVSDCWMQKILEVAKKNNADRIHVARQNLSPSALSSKRDEIPFWVTDYGFQLGQSYGPGGLAPGPGLATTIVDQIIDLQKSEEQLFAGLNDSCRRAIRKAERSKSLFIDATSGAKCIENYYQLAKLSAARTQEQLPSVDFYLDIHRELASVDRCTVVEVHVGDSRAAAAILLQDKQATYFLSGVSDPDYLEVRVNDFLHWSAINHCRRRGQKYYRLGPYFPAVPKGWPIEKVSRFKTKFGADPLTIVQGSLFLQPKRYAEVAKTNVLHICEELGK
jgi:hypothetical protein